MSGSPVDNDLLAGFERQIGQLELAGVINTFLARSAELFAGLELALLSSKHEPARDLARQLGSACAAIGVRHPAALCGQLDVRLSDGAVSRDELQAELHALEQSVNAARAELARLRDGLTG